MTLTVNLPLNIEVPDTPTKFELGLMFRESLEEDSGMLFIFEEVGQIFFNENAEIIMRGKILNDGIFYTKDLSVKCPSKYLDEMYTEDYSKENSSS